MAYRLKREESVAHGLRRIARKELGLALEQLRTQPFPDGSVHEARKSIKKVRAVLQLIEADHGTGLSGCKRRLRAVNRALSRLRDADVMKEVLTTLSEKNPRLFSEHTLARLQGQLNAHKEAATRTAIMNGSLKDAARALRKLRRGVKRWKPAHHQFPALAAGVEATHRRGRRAMARSLRRKTGADFHEWRKEIKALWYKLRLLDGCSASLQKDLRVLQRAETSLGDEHNVGLLCGYLSFTQSLVYNPMEMLRLRRTAERYQRQLRERAIASARAIYSMKSRRYLKCVKQWWKEWLATPEQASREKRRIAA